MQLMVSLISFFYGNETSPTLIVQSSDTARSFRAQVTVTDGITPVLVTCVVTVHPPSDPPSTVPSTVPSTGGSSIELEQCLDDWDFKVDSITGKGCGWVENSPVYRCNMPGAYDSCKKSCNNCPCKINENEPCKDDWDFKVSGKKGRGCGWVGKEPGDRCNFPGAKEACKQSCNNCLCENSSGDSSDNDEESKECYDDWSFKVNGEKGRGCSWVGRYPTERCKMAGANDACRSSCDNCPCSIDNACIDDWDFRVNGLDGKGCTWVKQHPTHRCNYSGARDSCKLSCNNCPCI